MAVTKTPRKKAAAAEAPKPSKAPTKKPAVKAATRKAAPQEAPAPSPSKKPGRKPKALVESTPVAAESPSPLDSAPKAEAKRKTTASATVAPLFPAFTETVLAAIREGRALEFIFADADTNAPRTFEPRQLTFDALSQAWYVWGWDRRYNAERFHRLDLLAEINLVEGVGRAAQGPYAEGTPANQIGGWLGGEPIAVKATLMKQWVFAVKQAPPAFPHFRLEETGDGQALVTFSATDLRAIARWIFQFGDGIQVAEPPRLLDRMRQVAAVWTGRERTAAPTPTRPEPPHAEHRPAPRPEAHPEPRRQEARPPRETRPREPEEEAPRTKPGKVEVIRFDRL